MTGDARPDVVVATPSAALCVYRNLGGGQFAPRVTTAIESDMQALVPGDVDGDGRTDLVLAHRVEQGIVSIVYGRPGGFAPARPLRTGLAPAGVANGDLNEDGRVDFAVANSGGRSVSVALAAPGGWFEDSFEVPSGPGPVAVAMGDLNLDGHLDLAIANGGSNTVSVRMGHGDGTFDVRPDVACAGSPSALACGDLNRDGIPDLAVANRAAGVVSVLAGLGDGQFGVRTDYGSGAGTSGVAIADLDGNGTADVITANTLGNTLTILRNRTGLVPVAVSDVAAEALAAGVRVSWRWAVPDAAAAALAFVQTAPDAAGPWQDADGNAPVAAAQLECVVAGALQPWVRVVVQTLDGARVASAAVRVQTQRGAALLQLELIPLVRAGTPCVIRYRLPVAAHVAMDVFDVRGRRVQRLIAGSQPAGAHRVQWDQRGENGAPVARGVYVVRLHAGGAVRSRRLVIANRAGGR